MFSCQLHNHYLILVEILPLCIYIYIYTYVMYVSINSNTTTNKDPRSLLIGRGVFYFHEHSVLRESSFLDDRLL